MSLRDEIQRLAHQMEGEDNAAYNLWSWLPSHAAAQRAHGDHAGNFRPAIADVMSEACEFISHRLHPTPAEREEAGDLYTCPCGDPHDESPEPDLVCGQPVTANVGPDPATLDAFVVGMRTDIERFAKHWREKHRTEPQAFPLSFPATDSRAWFEQFLAFVNHKPN